MEIKATEDHTGKTQYNPIYYFHDLVSWPMYPYQSPLYKTMKFYTTLYC